MPLASVATTPKGHTLERTLPAGYQWRGTSGAQARARALRASYRRVLRMRDPASVAAMARLHALAAEEDDQVAAAHGMAHVALLAAEEARVPWAQAAEQLLDLVEESAKPGPV